MIEREAIYKVAPILSEESFYKEEHQIIFKTVLELSDSGKKIDLLTVTQHLHDKNLLVQIGGPGYITQLTRRVASAAHIEQHARIIAEKYFSRELIRRFTECISKAYEDNIDELEALYNLTTQSIDDLLAGKSEMQHISTILDETRSDIEIRTQKALAGEIQGVNTGLFDLDNLNNGWQAGELIVIAARPSMGKTALGMTIGLHVARQHTVAMFSMEMPHADVRDRKLAILGRLSLSALKRPKVAHLDYARVLDAVEAAKPLKWWVSDKSGLTILQLRTRARMVQRRRGLDVLVVDYIGLMSGINPREMRAYQIEEISRGLKALAKELNIAVLCLAEVNRGAMDRVNTVPGLHDLRDSGAIEQDADVVMFIHRPIISNPQAGPEFDHYALLRVAKNRQGKTGDVHLHYTGAYTRFDAWGGPVPMASGGASRAKSSKGFGGDD